MPDGAAGPAPTIAQTKKVSIASLREKQKNIFDHSMRRVRVCLALRCGEAGGLETQKVERFDDGADRARIAMYPPTPTGGGDSVYRPFFGFEIKLPANAVDSEP